jgi:hypothetical protein
MRVRRFPIRPAHPERTCWGCDAFCAATSMRCGNGSERTQHPAELFGEDWAQWAAPVEGDAPGPGAQAPFGAASSVAPQGVRASTDETP